jgi:pilus assembly protein CpaE
VVPAGGPVGVDELLELVRSGASGYLPRPWSQDEVLEVCTNLLRKMPAHRADSIEPDTGIESKVIALFAPKGGAGVSTLAANLAVHIRKGTEKKALLLDLSPELGTAPVLLGAEPRYSYLDVVENVTRMDERLLYSFLEEHESGAWVMASPPEATMSRHVSAEQVHSLLRTVRRHFEYVIVDVGRGVIDEAAMAALELADERLLVTTGELPTLRNVKQVLPYVPERYEASESEEDDHVRLVVNRYQEGVSVTPKDIERGMGLSPFQIIQEDTERVGRSANLGQPIVLAGSSSYAKAVRQLGDRLAADDLKGGKRSPLSGLIKTLLPFGRTNGTGGGTPSGSGRSDQAKRQSAGAPDGKSPSGNHPERSASNPRAKRITQEAPAQ